MGIKEYILFTTLVCFALSSKQQGPGYVTMYYYTDWNQPYIHYNAGSGWTVPPGVTMEPSKNNDFPPPKWWVKDIVANDLVFVTNNGQGTWDHANGGGNYEVKNSGIYSLQTHVITTHQIFTNCSTCMNGGTCDNKTGTCNCKPFYYDPTCSGICPGGPNNSCNGHGHCNDGSSGNGACTCTAPYATCGSTPACTTDLDTDQNNCGACNKPCKVAPGVQSAVCAVGKCNMVCSSGWILCDDQCIQATSCVDPPLPGCETFNVNQCSGNDIVTPDKYESSRWWTPAPTDPDYLPSFGDYYRLVGHAHVTYSDNRTQATVELIPLHKDPTVTFAYLFGSSIKQSSPTMTFKSGSITTPLSTTILGSDGSRLELADIDFIWNVPPVNQSQGDYRNGQKGSIIEMFGWPHAEVEAECEAIGKMGWLGVKIYPPQEQVMSSQPFNNIMNPWYFMYQPVSYRLEGRMGTRNDLRNLIMTCRKYNVRVYADAVINHMVGGGNDANPHHRISSGGGCTTWGNKTTSNRSPSPFYTQDFAYTYNPINDQPPSQEFPAVPYGPLDFHCERVLNSWNDPLDLNAGWLTGLTDLNTERDNVQERIADYLTDLLGIGFSGFRVDAAKHIQPDDLVSIFGKLKTNLGGSLPDDFITWWEVLLGGEAQMLMCNKDSGYNYGAYLHDKLVQAGFTAEDVDKIKIWNSGYPKEPHADCGSITLLRNVIQNDDADQQNQGSTSRDMGDQGTVLVVTKDVALHRQFEVKLFQNPNGITNNDNDYPIRAILSSYYFPASGSRGIPDGLSDCSLCKVTCTGCQTVTYRKAHDPTSCGYDTPQDTQYTRVHRDKSIIMAMRSWMHLPTNVSNGEIGLPDNCT